MPQTLRLAVCMSNGMTLSDFITPVEILNAFNMADDPSLAPLFGGEIPYRLKVDYLAPSMGPTAGVLQMPPIHATQTYDDAIKSGVQFDILWIPAGPLPDEKTGTDRSPAEQIAFLKNQAPGAKFVCSVCLGSLALATAGILDGKRATTNKAFFRVVEAITSKNITWVAKARWVVDGNVWSSSGVTAGQDMALAFVEHLVGAEFARVIRGIFEVPEHGEGDDPFAKFHGLV